MLRVPSARSTAPTPRYVRILNGGEQSVGVRRVKEKCGGCVVGGGGLVEPVTIVVTALVAGAAAEISKTASAAVRDAYKALCSAVRSRLAAGCGGRGADTEVLDAYLQDPVGQQSRLVDALTAVGAGQDRDLLEAAERVVALTRPDSKRMISKYTVDLREARGVIVGDEATQTNMFS